MEACKQYCIEHNFQGFCALGEKAYFRVYTGTGTIPKLRCVKDAVFYVPNHNDRNTPTTWTVHQDQDAVSVETAHVKFPDAALSAAELAAEEVKRRLLGFVDKLRSEFFDDFLGNHIEVPLYDALLQLMSMEPFGQDKDALRCKVELERTIMESAHYDHASRLNQISRCLNLKPERESRRTLATLRTKSVHLGDEYAPYSEASVDAAQLNQRLETAKAEFDRVVASAMVQMKSFWMGELRAMLTAEVDICPADKTNKRHNSNEALRPNYNVVTKWLSRVLPFFEEALPPREVDEYDDYMHDSYEEYTDVIEGSASYTDYKNLGLHVVRRLLASDLSLDMLRRKLVEHPPFQLSNYTGYTDVILTRMEEHFDKAAAGLIMHIERSLSSKITSFDFSTDWLEIRANKDDFVQNYNAMTKVRIKPHILFSHLRVIFARLTPTLEMLLSVTQGVPISGIGPAALARHRTLEAEIAELKKARDGLCAALDIPSEELDEIRRKMGDDIS